MTGRRTVSLLALLLFLAALPATAASRVLPGFRFRVLHTAHFRIYYHQGEERLARALADVAESVHGTLPARLGLPAPGVTHVLLVDQDDTSNGWATPLPYDTVMVTAAWPAPSEIIGNTSDWLRLVFTHEYTHVLHLHQSRGWARVVRAVFGRAPLAFPNLFLPEWETEGLATFEETRETGAGRLEGGDSLAVVRQRVREMGAERLDQVSGGQAEWPGGLGPYLYGGFFTQYLATRFGEAKLGELARRSAGRLPFLAAPAFRATFGVGLGDLWREYQLNLALGKDATVAERPGDGRREVPPADVTAASSASDLSKCRRLTYEGYYTTGPRFTPDGRGLVYSVKNEDGFPALMIRDTAAESPRAPLGRRVTRRYGGEQISVSGGVAYFDQADYVVNVAYRSDLYAADLATHHVQRLTRDARLLAPDVTSDGRSLVCLRMVDGERRLAMFRVVGARVGTLRLEEVPMPGTQPGAIYGSPRFAPDGRQVAVERRLIGGPSEIVVIDVATGAVHVAVSSPRGRNVTPSWLPDGRSLVFASDRAGGPFQLYLVRVETGETAPLLSVAGGALAPAVSPGGGRLVYVGYTAAGYDLFEAPLGSGLAFTGSARLALAASDHREAPDRATSVDARPDLTGYSPLPTLWPRSWSPAADTSDNDLRAGFSTGGMDVLGRHAFGLTALWRLQAGSDAMFGPHRARPDWDAFYTYDRWRPTFFVSASDKTSFLPQASGGVRVGDAELRETNASAGVSLPFLLFRHGQVLQSAFNLQRNTLSSLRGGQRYARNSIQTAWAFNSAHVFGYSISPEQGVSIAVTSEQVRSAFGADGDADAFTGEIRAYLRLGGRHSVLAARTALGVANGDANVARVFYLGGPNPAGSLIDFGSGAFNMLRGYESREFAASHLGVANVEYRFPLWRIERGRGTWPIFLRTIHAAVFADAGQVWDRHFTWGGSKAALGAELSLDTILGFGLPLTASVGVARPWQGHEFRGTSAYLRIGRAF